MSHTPLSQRYRPFTWAQEITTATEAFIQQNRMSKRGSALRLMVPPYRLNPNAELNQGLVAKYIALPGMTGGQYWYDLCGKNKGTLANITAPYGWQGALRRPGGWGAMRLSGTTSAPVDCGNAAVFQISVGTMSCWFNTTTPGTGQRTLCGKANAYATLVVRGGVFGYYDRNFTFFNTSGINVADGKWHHALVVFRSGVASGTTAYLDGKPVVTGSSTVTNQDFSFRIGYHSGSSEAINAYIDDVSLWGRVFSAIEVAGLYNASKNQYRNEILCAYE